MSLDFSFSEENTMLVDAVGEAMKPWSNERKTELREMVNHSVFPQDMWQTFADLGLLACLARNASDAIKEQYLPGSAFTAEQGLLNL